tara:strand:+ start:3151 stop:3399 length:249 start_codon:yes stop_codon:yes gene_type:complete
VEKQILTTEELQQMRHLHDLRSGLVNKFGILEYDIQSLNLQKNKLIDQLKQSTISLQEMGNLLQQKYGEGNVNLETGEFAKR